MSDAIQQAIEAMDMARSAVGPFGVVVTKKLTNAIEALQALQSGEPVAVADRGVLNWIDGKQFAREADLYTTPQPVVADRKLAKRVAKRQRQFEALCAQVRDPQAGKEGES